MASHPLDYSSVPSVNPSGGTGAHESISASPSAFGGAIAEGLGTLGRGIDTAVNNAFEANTTQEQLDAQTHAAELHSWQSQQTTKLQEDFLSKRGRAAIDALPDFDKRLREIHDEAKGQAGNPYTTRLVDDQGRRLVDVTSAGAARHAATERKTWETRTAADSAQTYGSRATLLATQSQAPDLSGDLTVQNALGNSDNEVRNLFHGQGYEDPAIEAEVSKNRGRNVKAIVEQIASADAAADGASPGSVKRAFDFYKSQEEKIDAGSRVAIQNYLKAPLNQIAGRKVAEDTMGRFAAGGAPIDIAKRFVGAEEHAQREVLSGFIGKVGGQTVDPATTAWCAAFVNGVLHQAGIQGSDSLAARSFLNVGQKVDGKPQEGDVVVLSRGDPNGQQGHVGFYVGEGATPGSVRILAGNQGDKVAYAEYPASRVLGVRRVSRDDIGATPMIDTVAGKPLVSKGDAMLRILDDPLLRDRPQVQAAALAHMNKVYQAYELQGAQGKASFEVSVKNSTAEALSTGKVSQPLSYERFIQNYGGAEGEREWQNYQANVQLGSDIRSTATLAPTDLAALRERYTPQPGEHFVDQQKRLAVLDKAIAANEKAKQDDPADYLIRRTDFGKDTYQQFQTLMSDKAATPEMRTAYAGMYAEKMRAEQLRLGMPADKVQVVPSAYIDQLASRLNNPALNGGSLAVSQGIEAEAKLWGDHWPEVYRQLADKVQPVVRVIGSGVKPDAAQVLADLSGASLSDILKDQDTEKNATIKKDVLDAFKPLAGSMGGQDGATSVFNDFRGQAEKLAGKYVISGMTSRDAAAKAFDDLVGFKYTFQEGYRVPKDPNIDPTQVMAGALAVKTALGSGQQAPSNYPRFEEAKKQYPILRNLDIGYTENPKENSGYLEFYPPAEAGTKENPRPKNLPLGKPGLEVYREDTRPVDILADVVSHHLVNSDPKVAAYYQQFQQSLTPAQNNRLEEQYKYAQEKEGETRPFEQWKTIAGLPAYFRGYAFKQWPDDFNKVAYTGDQKRMFDDMLGYLKDPKNGPREVAPARDTIGGLTPDYLSRETAAAYARDGKWVTSPDEKGLMLTYNDRAVRMTDGGPLIVSWRELQDTAKRTYAVGDPRFSGVQP